MTREVRLVVDGVEVSVPEGTHIVEAAREAGIEIPVFCHHPLLEPAGMCRMCLVEVGTPVIDRETGLQQMDDEGRPVIRFSEQLTAACTTSVSEGMVVRTDTEAVAEARRGAVELLLTSHPLDCPVCDKGGECPLQNLTMRYGAGESRFVWTEKQHFAKPVALGPLILLDRERCVLCARCIRFLDEIADDEVLSFESRGRRTQVTTLSEPPLDSYFSGNTTDICPVGALTTRDFRFQARVWELVGKPGVCAHCPVGCNVMHDVRGGRVLRVMPRRNDHVNQVWLCDKGRFAHHYAASEERITTPMVRRMGKLEPATWEEALDAAADRLRAIRDTSGPQAIGGIASGSLPNEDLYMFGRFMRAVLGSNNVDHTPAIVRDEIPIEYGLRGGLSLPDIGAGTTVVVVGLDVEEEAPVLYLALRAAQRRGARLLVIGGRPQKLESHADVALRYRYGGEDAVMAALIRRVLQRGSGATGLTSGDQTLASRLREAVDAYTPDVLSGVHPVREHDLDQAARAIAEGAELLVPYGREALVAGMAPALAALLIASGHRGSMQSGLVPVGPQANSQGAADMGVLPGWLPGYRRAQDEQARAAIANVWPGTPPAEEGLSAQQMREAELEALLVLDADPLAAMAPSSGEDAPSEQEPSAGARRLFAVVFAMFPTVTVLEADVVFPLQSAPEREGTFTSMTRRVQRFAPAVPALGEARPAWQVLRDLGRRLGCEDSFESAEQVADEIARVVPGYEGMTYDALGALEVTSPEAVVLPFAPHTDARHVTYDGTAYANEFGEGRTWLLEVRERALESLGAAAYSEPGLTWRPDGQRPHDGLLLVPTRVVYDARPEVWSSEVLRPLVPEPHIVMSPFDAGPLGLVDGSLVRVASESATLSARLRVRDGLTPGVVLAPENLAWETPLEVLLGGHPVVAVAVEQVGA